jgi:hypothetical protein
MEMLTSYQRFQGHATFAFGLTASGDVSKIVLQMPNAAVQLVVVPLFWRGVFCFKVRVRGDVLRRFFGPKDFFRKQIKAGENKEGVKHEITHESKKQVKGKLTLDGALLWGAFLPGGLLAFVHGLGVFSSGARGEDAK